VKTNVYKVASRVLASPITWVFLGFGVLCCAWTYMRWEAHQQSVVKDHLVRKVFQEATPEARARAERIGLDVVMACGPGDDVCVDREVRNRIDAEKLPAAQRTQLSTMIRGWIWENAGPDTLP
jgi:hypothetical protein